MQRFDHRDYVSMTMEFRCNLRCVHCMIEGTMDRLVPEGRERFEELLAHNAQHRRWKGLILTGSEITLHRDLPSWRGWRGRRGSRMCESRPMACTWRSCPTARP